MERLPIEPSEMELRRNKDYINKLNMIGEGGPIYDQSEMLEKRREESHVFEDEEKLPRNYQ
ncbi:hypothetical protein [Sporosarcina sp. E16_8]|uniref:hypothetical protein n=1 Tax=Sporosarcina sp. E16_8 TaxID=2789295 RepID=UPI001A90D1E9|nr:hypothetical protein [Sporosarcina sp. E16_8]MBO0587250.1 hypothetical protein [Sporosarcina sp. E16_8]